MYNINETKISRLQITRKSECIEKIWLFWATENKNLKEIKNFLTGNTSESQQYEVGKGGISFCFCPPHSKGKFRVQCGNSDC